jgi:hypothetical protein
MKSITCVPEVLNLSDFVKLDAVSAAVCGADEGEGAFGVGSFSSTGGNRTEVFRRLINGYK